MRGAIPALASLLALSACGDSPTNDPGHTFFEGLSLTFSGGELWATHQSPVFTEGELAEGPFTIAFPDSVGGWVIAGFLPKQDGKGDLFIVQLVERRTGTFGPCGPTRECHGRLLEGLDPNDLQAVATYWEIVSGTVTVEKVAGGRMEGPFSNLVLQSTTGQGSRTVTEGYFNVELLSDAEGVDIMRCFLKRLTGGSCG